MSDSLPALLLRLSEAGEPAILWGRAAAPHFGTAFERLLAQRVLIEEPEADTWAPCRACECDQPYRQIQEIDGRAVAVCPLDRAADTVLGEHDRKSFRIDMAALARLLATTSGLGEPDEIIPELWLLGRLADGRAVFLALSVPAALQPALTDAMRRAARGAPMTLLVPARLSGQDVRRLEDGGVQIVPTSQALDGAVPFRLAISRPMGEPRLTMDKGRLVVGMGDMEVPFPQRPFDLLWILANAVVSGGGILERRAIERALWPNSVVSTTAVHDAIRDLRGQLKAFNASRGPAVSATLFETHAQRGYRLALQAEEIRLIGASP